MSYQPIRWVNGVTSLSAQNLNHMEQGIKDNETLVADAVNKLSTISMLPSQNRVELFNINDVPSGGSSFHTSTPDNGYIIISARAKNRVSMDVLTYEIGKLEYTILDNYFTIVLPVVKNYLQFTIFAEPSDLKYFNVTFCYAKKGV